MKPDWSRAPAWAYAFAQVVYEHASDAKDFAWISKDGYIIASPQYLNDTCWPYSEENFGASSFRVLQYRPESLPINNSHSASKADLVFAALVDCVTVMERDLNGLALIQPELKQAKQAIEQFEIVDAEFVEWNGEGLPPVGTVCEYYADEDDWRRCEVVAHRGEMAVVWANANHIFSSQGGVLRPIRTPEQIAAEERKKIEDEIQDICTNAENNGKPYFKALYEAGYRKQVAP